MSKERLNYLRRKTADEAELWAADRIEELERENNELAARIGKELNEENLALQADNARLREAMRKVIFAVSAIEGSSDESDAAHDSFMSALAATDDLKEQGK